MGFDDLGPALGIYGSTLIVCFVAGLVPVVNAELWLIAVVAMIATPAPLPLVVVLAALGQMGAKLVLYRAGQGAASLPTGRRRAQLERARARLATWKQRPLLVLWCSATFGVPPLYLVALLAGALEYRLRTFCIVGMIGRVLRFSAVVAVAWTGATW